MSDKAYCGLSDEPPKGYTMGTAEECLALGQVRRYGLKKIDKDLIKTKKKSNNLKKTKKDILKKIETNKGRIRKLKFEYDRHVNPDKKKKLKDVAVKYIDENAELLNELKKLEKLEAIKKENKKNKKKDKKKESGKKDSKKDKKKSSKKKSKSSKESGYKTEKINIISDGGLRIIKF